MTTLPDLRIIEYGERIVSPFRPERVQPASYDLTLGTEFIRFKTEHWHVIDLADMRDDSAEKVVYEDQFVIQPGEFVLGITEEVVKCPNNIVGRLEGKSTIGRVGLLIHVTAGFVDPGWTGRLTLEIYNVRRVPIILRPGKPFCQMSWAYLEPPDKPYAGRYQGADTVEASKSWEEPRRGFARGGFVGPQAGGPRGVMLDPGFAVLSPNHPARGLLTQEEMDESGYDGPMASTCCGALLEVGTIKLGDNPSRDVAVCSKCKQEVRL